MKSLLDHIAHLLPKEKKLNTSDEFDDDVFFGYNQCRAEMVKRVTQEEE